MANNLTKARTVEDLERKYNFAKMLGLSKNVEANANSILKVENELNNILTSIVINLSEVLDSQSDVSLWFYSGIPTTSNLPYTSWSTPDDHDGDIYYDRSTGYVYQFDKDEMWVVNPNPDLVSAMALTNAEIDTSDNERKVFFTTPTTPYSNGDWWIKNDGSLYICQITKSTGTYEEQDFISSNDYTDSVATKIDDVIEVLKGTITLISDSYAKFTDLATGGSTTIAGENITSGNIVSNNYVQNQTGMKIALNDGTIDSKNFKTDTSGNIYLGSGAKVIGGDGLMTSIILCSNSDYQKFGFDFYGIGSAGSQYVWSTLEFNFEIPSNFVVESAYITLYHLPILLYDDYGLNPIYTRAKKIKLYKSTDASMKPVCYDGMGIHYNLDTSGETEINNAFDSGNDGWTPEQFNDYTISTKITPNLKNNISTPGKYRLKIRSDFDVASSAQTGEHEYYTAAKNSAYAWAMLQITGYTSYS